MTPATIELILGVLEGSLRLLCVLMVAAALFLFALHRYAAKSAKVPLRERAGDSSPEWSPRRPADRSPTAMQFQRADDQPFAGIKFVHSGTGHLAGNLMGDGLPSRCVVGRTEVRADFELNGAKGDHHVLDEEAHSRNDQN